MKLEIKNLKKAFSGNVVLDSLSLCLETGHIYGLFGRNGVGKSTFFRCISDQMNFDGGEVLFDGNDVRRNDVSSQMILSNEDNLFPSSVRVRDIVASFSAMRNVDEELIRNDLKAWGIDEKKRWEKLSTGQRTMLKNALALESGASFIFLDEPVLGLDAINRDAFYTRLLEVFSEDRCIVVSSHIIDEVASFASDIIFLEGGHITLEMPSEELSGKAHMLSGHGEKLDQVKGSFRLVSRGEKLAVPYICIVGDLESIPDGVLDETIDLNRLFIESTKEVRG